MNKIYSLCSRRIVRFIFDSDFNLEFGAYLVATAVNRANDANNDNSAQKLVLQHILRHIDSIL